jgi:hypothetical protein
MTKIKIEPLSEVTLPAMARFSAKVWKRPNSPEYFAWRYGRPDACTTLVIYHDAAEILATVSGFHATYKLQGKSVGMLETCDWYCRPDLRGSGLGIRIMTALMKHGDRPIIALGGSKDTLSLLPRMGFSKVGTGTKLFFPLSAGIASHITRKRVPLALVSLALKAGIPIYRSLSVILHGFSSKRLRYELTDELLRPQADKVTLSSRQTEMNEYLWLRRGSDWTGVILRAYPTEGNLDGPEVYLRIFRQKGYFVAQVLDIVASHGSTSDITAVCMSVGSALRRRGISGLLISTTDRLLVSSLRRVGFVGVITLPCLVWSNDKDARYSETHLLGMRGDDGYKPEHQPS